MLLAPTGVCPVAGATSRPSRSRVAGAASEWVALVLSPAGKARPCRHRPLARSVWCCGVVRVFVLWMCARVSLTCVCGSGGGGSSAPAPNGGPIGAMLREAYTLLAAMAQRSPAVRATLLPHVAFFLSHAGEGLQTRCVGRIHPCGLIAPSKVYGVERTQ